MFWFHIKVFFKTLIKSKVLTLINVTGLVAGLTVSILVWMFITHELSYDRSFKNSDRVYRVIRNWQGSEKFSTSVSAPLANSLGTEFPEVIASTRLYPSSNNIIVKGTEVFREDHVLVVDSSFFEVFGLALKTGNTDLSLKDPRSVVISQTVASKIFADSNPIGQMLSFESSNLGINRNSFTVTGIYDDLPPNSHMRPDFLISSGSFSFINNLSPFNHFLQTYVLLERADQKDHLESIFPEFMEQFYGTDYYNYSGSTYLLQPIQDIHLNTRVYQSGYETAKGSYFTIYFFPFLALFIILISVINFVNLYTSQSLGRSKEVLIKRINGASSFHELLFFIFDSIIVFIVALILSICAIELLFPALEALIERPLDKSLIYAPANIISGVTIILILGILAGLYPAIVLVSNKSVSEQNIWKDFKRTGVFFDSKLIILQFAMCIFFVIGSIFVFKQFRYMDKLTGKGFNKDNVILISNPWYLGKSHASFKQALRTHNRILQVSCSESVPGIDNFSVWGHPVDSAENDCHITVIYCDHNYANTLGMKLVRGRFFSEEHPTDNLAMVLNETAIKKLGWTEPIGKRYSLDTIYRVIGVIQDIHYESLHNPIDPMGMVLIAPGTESFISIRIAPGETKSVISFVSDTWDAFVPERPLEYSFMDKEFDLWYRTDRKIGVFTTLLSGLAIIISCLGLIGLMIFTIIRRSKEIGIRKVNGASSRDIHLLFIRDASRWLLLAFIIAVPASYIAVMKWLQSFAYKTEISWWLFIAAGLAVYLIALGSILWQSHRAANQNTIDSLRYE